MKAIVLNYMQSLLKSLNNKKTMPTPRLAAYRADAVARAVNRTPTRMLNDSLDHANILIETMIGMAPAGTTVKIYSGLLPHASFGDEIAKCQAAKIDILVDDDSEIAWLNQLPQQQLDKISLWKIGKPRPNHFLCVSSGAFRYEVEPSIFMAEASFLEPSTVETLNKAFDRYIVGSTQILKAK